MQNDKVLEQLLVAFKNTGGDKNVFHNREIAHLAAFILKISRYAKIISH